MGGGKTAYLKDEDRELLKTIVQNHFNNPGYSDEMIVKKVNDGDLLKLDGAQISVMHVAKTRKDLGLKKRSGPRMSLRSQKTRNPEDLQAVSKRGPKPKKDRTPGDNHPVTISQLREAIEAAETSATTAKDLVEQYAAQEKARVEA